MKVKDRERLKRLRLRKGYTQRELAFLTGVTQTTIYHLEAGSMKTLSEKLGLAIAKRLDSDWEDLFVEQAAKPMPAVTNGVHSTPQAMSA